MIFNVHLGTLVGPNYASYCIIIKHMLLILLNFQAVRVTVACGYIKTLGLELRTRPFAHSRTEQLELDSFLLYTSSITVDVSKIVNVNGPNLYVFFLFKGSSCTYSYEATICCTSTVCCRSCLEIILI